MPNNIKDTYTGGIGTTNRKLLDLLNVALKGLSPLKKLPGFFLCRKKELSVCCHILQPGDG